MARLVPSRYAGSRSDVACRARTEDVSRNADAFWRNIPEAVWDFTIGGSGAEEMASYRERPLFGRPLTPGEVRYVRDVARRLAALRPDGARIGCQLPRLRRRASAFA